MTAYLLIMILFCVPLSVTFFVKVFVDPEVVLTDRSDRAPSSARNPEPPTRRRGSVGRWIHNIGISSPFAAAFSVPLKADPLSSSGSRDPRPRNFPHSWGFVAGYFAWSTLFNGMLLALMVWLFSSRWRVSQD